MKTPPLGIDLGTTYSAVAYIDEVTGRPTAIKTIDDKSSLASVVAVDQGQVQAVGDLALNRWFADGDHVARWIKRSMGDPDYRFQGLSPEEVSAAILKSLKASAELHFGCPVTETVITCPAYFGSNEIQSTLRAGELAGFKVLEIIKEPTAAAVYFGVDHMQEDETILVCDLGGGTYDATILHHSKGTFRPLATTGDREMGGHDWTSDLMDLVSDRFYDQTGIDLKTDLAAGQILYEECERAKRELQKVADVCVNCASQGKSASIKITRQEFEDRGEWRMQHLVTVTNQALEKAGLSWDGISRILLVGGSSRLRRLSMVLEEASGKRPQQSSDPDLSVAFGAAICAAGKVRPKNARPSLVEKGKTVLVVPEIKRIIARALGTRVLEWRGGVPRIANALLIPHSTEIPESGLETSREDFEISSNGQKCIDVPVVEFEDDDDFELLGNFRFTCPVNAKRGDRIKIIFHYDKNTIATLKATDARSGRLLDVQQIKYEEPDLAVCRAQPKPRWVVFAIDASGSMDSNNKFQNAKQAVLANARQLLGSGAADCLVAVVSFASSAEKICDPTSDFAEIESAVKGMSTGSTTSMDEGIRLATEILLTAPPGTDRDIVLLTDGVPDDDRRSDTRTAAEDAKSSAISLCTLGIGSDDVDKNFLDELTPLSLVIERGGDFSGSMHTLLTRSASVRSGGLVTL